MADTATSEAGGKMRGGSGGARSRKQRILWDSDNVTADGKTSIGVLLEWLTAPGNYERWRDGKAQFGETREKLCTEINTLMRKNGITHRENANIRTQISELERSYDAAVAWLVQNGYEDGQLPVLPAQDDGSATTADANGVTTNSTHPAHHAEVQVLRLCRYFHVLSAIMRQPAHQPRARRPYNRSSSSSASRRTSTDGQKEGGESAGDEDSAMDTASENGTDGTAATGSVLLKRKASSISNNNILNVAASTASMILPAGGNASTASTGASATSGANAAAPVMMSSTNFANFENTQRMILEAAREDRERKRFQLDEERIKLECEKLRYELQVKKIELTVQRAVARKQLLDAGISEDQVNTLLAQALAS